MNYEILRLSAHPEWAGRMADWFSSKWQVPREAYEQSMAECLQGGAVPEWYAAVAEGQIIGGLGVIENDFHPRKDLTPNVCAVFTEPEFRCRGVAGALLGRVSADQAALGNRTLYLLTDHTAFYERYGWRYLCPVTGDGETEPSRMYVHEAE